MSSTADIVRKLLVDLGVCVEHDEYQSDWRVFVNTEPDTPDNCVTVYSSSDILQGRTQPDGIVQSHLGFQLRVRGTNHETTFDKITSIAAALENRATCYRKTVTIEEDYGTETTSYVVHSVTRISGIFPLGIEQSNRNRYLFTANYTLTLD